MMPFALVIIGLVVLIAAIRGNEGQLGHLLANDFFGSNSFIWWGAAVLIVGSIGYIPKLKGFSVAFLSLILIAMVVANKGFFAQIAPQLSAASTQPGAAGNADVGTGWGTLAPQQQPTGIAGQALGVAGQVAGTASVLGSLF